MQIRALEEELGGALFVRTSRRVELTTAGMLLRDEAGRTLELAAHAKETVQRALRGETGRVRVAFAGNAVFSGKLMGDLGAFRAAYPDAELVVQEMAPQLQADALGSGLLDVGYAPGHGVGKDDEFVSVPVGAWRMVVALHRDHPLAARKRSRAPRIGRRTAHSLHGHRGRRERADATARGDGERATYRASRSQHLDRPGIGRIRTRSRHRAGAIATGGRSRTGLCTPERAVPACQPAADQSAQRDERGRQGIRLIESDAESSAANFHSRNARRHVLTACSFPGRLGLFNSRYLSEARRLQ